MRRDIEKSFNIVSPGHRPCDKMRADLGIVGHKMSRYPHVTNSVADVLAKYLEGQ